ncbi:MAG TPA: L,D-transpeptidase family protein [Croceibacterium sp.]|nr:L,D-transpeptidase family protein [Croceibacterium sp.]
MHNNLRLIFGAVALLAAVPLAAQPRGDEPVAVPSSIKQGVDFVYVDPQMSSVAIKKRKPRNWLQRIFGGSREDREQRSAPHAVFLQLAQGLEDYRSTWGALPQAQVTAGAALRRGSTGRRVDQLRTRLGLAPGGGFDEALFQRVSEYQRVHGLDADGIAGRATIASLNAGAEHYERRIAINMERAWRLPATNAFERYVLVDSGAAEAYLFDRDRVTDSMRVVVGSPETKTPMMAVLMRTAKANPYWYVPPELIRSLTARRIGQQGLSYLSEFHYEVLAEWDLTAPRVDPRTVNWKAIASGKAAPTVMVRQLPGPWNSMGEMKFEMPNDFGIYLHDTPHKELFAEDDRWLSNGCVRLEDYRRFASWVFDRVPQASSQLEQSFELPRPVPVYMTYLTVAPSAGSGVVFRADPYGFDALAMPQMEFGRPGIASAS